MTPKKPMLQPSRRKRWPFRLAAICLSLLPLVLIEVALRLFGVGNDLQLVIPVASATDKFTHQLNELADRPFFGVTDLSGPEPRPFALPKPAGTYRIIVLGESTVAGFPYPPELAFPRQMEILLQKQRHDDKIEVLNAGITGISSHAIADLARQALAAEPDLLIVHAGHNEFYGPGGVTSRYGRLPASLLRTSFALRKTRLGQIDRLWTKDTGQELSELLPADLVIPFDSPDVQRAAREFQSNLTRIVTTARAPGVRVLLTTVTSNVRDQSPIRARHSRHLPALDEQRWIKLVEEAEQLLSAGDAARAQPLLSSAEAIDPHHARLLYRQGQCLESLGHVAEAATKFELARDHDGCRFRAPSSFRDVVRKVAEESKSSGVHFADWAGDLAASVAPRAVGSDLFLEHVHYRLSGHYRLAVYLAEVVQTEIIGGEWNERLALAYEEMREELRISAQDELAARSLALQVQQISPFAEALDAAAHARRLSDEIRQLFLTLSPTDQSLFASLSMADMQQNLPLALARAYDRAGDAATAKKWRDTAALRRPWERAP